MSTGSELGFDIDEETIELFDAILVNLTYDDELKEEFKKLRFVKTLQSRYNSSKGPIKQLMEKMAKIEKTYYEIQMDNQRAVRDMSEMARAVQNFANARTAEQKKQSLQRLEGITFREGAYSWNK